MSSTPTSSNPSQKKPSAWARGPPTLSSSSTAPPPPATSTTSTSSKPTPATSNAPSTASSINGSAGSSIAKKTGGRPIGDGVLIGKGAKAAAAGGGGSINFGSIDAPSPALSSSPAKVPVTGSHLEQAAVRSFGSLAANSAAPPSTTTAKGQTSAIGVKEGASPAAAPSPPAVSKSSSPAPPSSSPIPTAAPSTAPAPASSKPAEPKEKKKVDISKLFQTAPSSNASSSTPSTSTSSAAPAPSSSQQTQSSTNAASPPMPSSNRSSSSFTGAPSGLPSSSSGNFPPQFHPNQQQQHLRPPPQGSAAPRSPPSGNQQPQQQQQAPQFNRGSGSMNGRPGPPPNGATSPRPPPPQFHPQQQGPHPGMPPYGYYQPPGGDFYPYPYPPPQFHPNHPYYGQMPPPSPSGGPNMPLSPSAAPSTPNQRPSSVSGPPPQQQGADPSRPPPHHAHSGSFQRPPQNYVPPTFSPQPPHQTPGSPSALRSSAVAFTPAKRAPLVITNPATGKAIDVKSPPTPSAPAVASPAAKPAADAPAPKKPVFGASVRLETPAQQKARLAEEAEEKRIKDVEAKEEAERKERKAAAAKAKEKEASDKKDAEAKKIADEEAAKSKDEAAKSKKEDDEKKAVEDKKVAEQKAQKDADDKKVADEKKARDEKKAAEEKRVAEEKEQKDQVEREKKAKAEKASADKKAEEDKEAADAAADKKKADEEAAKQKADADTKAAALAAEEKKLADTNAPAPPAISSPAPATPSGLPALVEGKVSESPSPSPAPGTPSALPTPPSGLPSKPIEGLPSKPVESAADDQKRPESLDLGPASSAAVAQSIQSAKFVSEPNAVSYPEGISSPKPELNQSATGGKFRYDRDFLLQFMEVCKEKPESLPPLESIGLEPDTSSSSGFRRGGGPSRMGSMTGTPRSSQPFNAGSIGRAPVGGSGFGMGNFAGTGKSSAERFAASKSGAGVPFPSQAPSMSRQPSSNTAFNAPGSPAAKGSRVRSERGQRRGDAPSFQAQASGITLTEAEIVPLVESANRWIPGAAKRGSAVDENDPAVVDRKVKALLNKLTMENFDSISSQILVWASKSENETDGRTLRQVIRLIFEKSTDEAHWSEMYARLCRKMMDTLSDKVQDEKVVDNKGNPFTGGSLFRKYLLNRCQEDFEKGWAARDSTAAAAKDKAQGDQEKIKANEAAAAAAEEKGEAAPPKEEAALMSDEYYAAQKAKRQGLGLVRLIGELFKLEMLTERIMHECVKKLLTNVVSPEEEDIESLCRLLTTVGKSLDSPKARHHIDVYFKRIGELRNNPVVSSRMQFMLQDVMELRQRRWETRNEVVGVQTLAEVREKAAKDAAKATQDSMNRSASQRHDSSRGGSRRGQNRTDFGAPPQTDVNGWTSAPPRNAGKVGDLAAFGKIEKRASAGPGSFGPSTVFGKKGRNASVETPPISRTPSAGNMFALLNQDASEGGAPAAESTEPAPQRKRLVLAPRSKPLPGTGEDGEEEEGEEEGEDAEGEEEETAGDNKEPEMSKEQADAKIKANLDEFWNVKDVNEGSLGVKELPVVYQITFLDKMIGHALDAKKVEFEAAIKLFKKLSDDKVVDAETFYKAFEPSAEFLDDSAVDIPQVYTLYAQLLAAAGLSKEDVEKLGATIDLGGSPAVPPTEKLSKAFAEASESS